MNPFALRFLALAASVVLASCSSVPAPVTPYANMTLSRIDKPTSPGAKTYALVNEWNNDGWVLKKGAMISFNSDGTGLFEGTIYNSVDAPKNNEVRLHAIAYGKDSNKLFSFPGADAGYAMHVSQRHHERVHTAPFGFDARQFDSIQNVTLAARRVCPLGIPSASK